MEGCGVSWFEVVNDEELPERVTALLWDYL
jgi:hypothetical protein